MFFEITAFLSVFQLIYASDATNGCNCANLEDLAASVCDETGLKNIQDRMDLLLAKYENLLNMNLNQQFKKDLEEFKAALVTAKEPLKPVSLAKTNGQEDCMDTNENLIDIRGDFTNRNEEFSQNNCQLENATKGTATLQSLPRNCAEALKTSGQNGVYQIKTTFYEPFHVYCLRDSTFAWTVIQRRQDGTIDFYRRWCEYQQGFGDLEGEFFIGLDKLHALTQSRHELWVQMEDFEGNKRWARYNNFAIGGASDGYTLKSLGAFAGNGGDSLSYHKGMKWTTLDVDHDKNSTGNCAQKYSGAWWYNNCHNSNLNGLYLRGEYGRDQIGRGIDWKAWHFHNYSLKYVHMAIRPV